jgi:RimJ/RimL family protein N-acetyltransferase
VAAARAARHGSGFAHCFFGSSGGFKIDRPGKAVCNQRRFKRDNLPDVDIGYAFLPEFWGLGFALEAAEFTMRHAAGKFGLQRVIAVVSQGNNASIRVLEKLGMRHERMFAMRPDEPEVGLYGRTL